jgi:hypothetical protein
MGAIIPIIVKVTAIPAVSQLINKLTGKLLGNKGVDQKVSAAVAPAAIVEIVKYVLLATNPELGALVAAQEANLLAGAVAVGAFIAYWTDNSSNADGS